MRPSSFKQDGWALIIPVLFIVSGLTKDPFHTVALIGALVGCLVIAVLAVAEFVRWIGKRRLAKTTQPDEVPAQR